MRPYFSHIINVVGENENPSLHSLQRITTESLTRAKKYSEDVAPAELIAVHFEEGRSASLFSDRSALLKRNVTHMTDFTTKRDLPLVYDILEAGISVSDGDFIVFSNSDIILTPWFYKVVRSYLSKGHDALVINRRRIPARLRNEDFEVMLSHAGRQHIGYDCFVFRRELFKKFISSGVCIGIPMSGNDIFHNLFTFAERPALLANQHLTFHLGMELVKEWGDKEYVRYNVREFRSLLKQLRPHMSIEKFPGSGLPFLVRHFRWLMNPTYDYRTMFSLDISQWSHKRPEPASEEVPGLSHRYYEWLQTKVNFREED